MIFLQYTNQNLILVHFISLQTSSINQLILHLEKKERVQTSIFGQTFAFYN